MAVRTQQSVPVSIHAPAWGATGYACRVCLAHDVSIHAPAWGATLSSNFWILRPSVSIHAPAWGATLCPHCRKPLREVSIHAPAWGATFWIRRELFQQQTFQSTRPRGARPVRELHNLLSEEVSIHAPAWGATHVPHCACYSAASFNPRARVGRDVKGKLLGVLLFLFQSTRPRGARRNQRTLKHRLECFNPRARVGRDSCL